MVVVESVGSAPGRVGFKMAVDDHGGLAGSIGGGVMEFRMVELAKAMLAGNGRQTILRRQVHDPEAGTERSGMICSGEQTQAFIPLGHEHLEVVRHIKGGIASGAEGLLTISPSGFSYCPNSTDGFTPGFERMGDDSWCYSEVAGLTDTAYIFGAGHISLPLSQILRLLGFRVVVFDNREGLSTFESNSFAHRKQIVDFTRVGHLVAEGDNSYVIIMSFAHRFDQVILRQLLEKRLKYLGMIGSKSKVKAIFDQLISEGFPEKAVQRVDSPIGLPIGSQTPAEIAVSIAAKIVQVRNSK